ncbi:MAG: hypothetical protein AAGN64_01030, partial [Bacteroidota bacterium]
MLAPKRRPLADRLDSFLGGIDGPGNTPAVDLGPLPTSQGAVPASPLAASPLVRAYEPSLYEEVGIETQPLAVPTPRGLVLADVPDYRRARGPQAAVSAPESVDLAGGPSLQRLAVDEATYNAETTPWGRLFARARRGMLNLRRIREEGQLANTTRRLALLEAIEAGGAIPRGLVSHPMDVAAYQGMPADRRREEIGKLRRLLGTGTSDVAEVERRIRATDRTAPVSPATRALLAADSFSEAIDALQVNPAGIAAEVVLGSAPSAAPSLLAGAAGGGVAGPAGAAVAGGTVSGATDYAASFLGALAAEGVDTSDPDALARAIEADPMLVARAHKKARIGATIVGAADAASLGVAGRALVPGGTIARQLGNQAAQAIAGGALGIVGEAGRQLA